MADLDKLTEMAIAARQASYSPYSGFPVGAALETVGGKRYAGCNVENAAFPLGTCAEQSAISAMVIDGEKSIAAMVVAGPGEDFCTPCGGCRQRIREFCVPDAVVRMVNENGDILEMDMEKLLPESFGPENLSAK